VPTRRPVCLQFGLVARFAMVLLAASLLRPGLEEPLRGMHEPVSQGMASTVGIAAQTPANPTPQPLGFLPTKPSQSSDENTESRSGTPDQTVPPPTVDPQFAVDLYRSLSIRQRDVNLAVSPLGVATALKALHAGAKNRTAGEIAAALHLPLLPSQDGQSPPPVNRPAGDTKANTEAKTHAGAGPEAQIGAAGGTNPQSRLPKPSRLSVANSLWVQKGAEILPSFRKALDDQLGIHFDRVDFSVGSAFRKPIEEWARRETGGRISDVIGPLTADSVSMLLINLTWFKARWRIQFPSPVTSPAPFATPSGLSVTVPMMAMKARVPYCEDESFQVLELPYDDRLFSMVLLLPKDANRLEDLEYSLDSEGLLSRIERLERSTVQVFLPRFNVAASWQLRRDLERLKISRLFTSDADFSGIDGAGRCRLTSLFHYVSVRVDEAGTEAEAATSALMVDKSLDRSPTFRADHPFIFLIKDSRNGDILFIGRLCNPSPPAPAGR
jgi:serpin B